jgi:hypothetical protein
LSHLPLLEIPENSYRHRRGRHPSTEQVSLRLVGIGLTEEGQLLDGLDTFDRDPRYPIGGPTR